MAAVAEVRSSIVADETPTQAVVRPGHAEAGPLSVRDWSSLSVHGGVHSVFEASSHAIQAGLVPSVAMEPAAGRSSASRLSRQNRRRTMAIESILDALDDEQARYLGALSDAGVGLARVSGGRELSDAVGHALRLTREFVDAQRAMIRQHAELRTCTTEAAVESFGPLGELAEPNPASSDAQLHLARCRAIQRRQLRSLVERWQTDEWLQHEDERAGLEPLVVDSSDQQGWAGSIQDQPTGSPVDEHSLALPSEDSVEGRRRRAFEVLGGPAATETSELNGDRPAHEINGFQSSRPG